MKNIIEKKRATLVIILCILLLLIICGFWLFNKLIKDNCQRNLANSANEYGAELHVTQSDPYSMQCKSLLVIISPSLNSVLQRKIHDFAYFSRYFKSTLGIDAPENKVAYSIISRFRTPNCTGTVKVHIDFFYELNNKNDQNKILQYSQDTFYFGEPPKYLVMKININDSLRVASLGFVKGILPNTLPSISSENTNFTQDGPFNVSRECIYGAITY